MVQIVTGWGAIHDNIRRWSRTVKADGACTPDAIADACNDAVRVIHGRIMESGQPWCIRSQTVDDVGGSLGSTVEFKTRRLFIEQDLGITDLARVYRLWRVDNSQQVISRPIYHCDQTGPENIERGPFLARWGDERWREDGDFNDDGNHDASILIYNWGEALANGRLKVTYWFVPDQITADVFTETDDSGNRTSRPQLPKIVWPFITDYAKLTLLETMGDAYKQSAMWARLGGTNGLINQLRVLLGQFQTGQPTMVADQFTDEGI